MGPSSTKLQQCQRLQVTKDLENKAVNITVERYDSALGWYTAGALSLPMCQVPLLEQALDELGGSDCLECTASAPCARKIIPFPLLAQPEPALTIAAEGTN